MLRSRFLFSGLLALSTHRLFLIVPGILLLVGCGGGGGSVKSPAPVPVSTQIPTPVTIPVTTPPSVIGQAVSKISLAVDKASVQPGQSTRMTATLTNGMGTVLSGKLVTFTLGDTPAGSAATNGVGQAASSYTLPLTQPVQTYSVKASFAGDANFVSCQISVSLTVSALATSLSLTVDKPGVSVGQSVTLTAPLTWAGGVLKGKPITFALGGTPIGTATTDAITGKATLTYTLAAGTPAGATTLTAAFAGDAGLAPCSASAPITVLISTSLTLTPTTVTVTALTSRVKVKAVLLDVNGKPLANEKVYASPGAISPGSSATTDATGTVNLVVVVSSGPPIPGLPPRPPLHGAHAFPILFDGDTTYAATSTNLTVIFP